MTLADAIARVDRAGFNAIDFALLDFWPTDETLRPGADVRESIRRFEPGRTWNARQVRCWKKGALPVNLASSGGHDVQFPGRRVYPLRFILRHYPIRSTAHGQRKVFTERIPRFADEERERGWHVQYAQVRTDAPLTRDARRCRCTTPARSVPSSPQQTSSAPIRLVNSSPRSVSRFATRPREPGERAGSARSRGGGASAGSGSERSRRRSVRP